MTVKFILFVSCLIIFKEIMAKYEITLERIDNAFGEDDKAVAFEGLRVKKYNRTSFVLNGKLNVKIPFDDSIDILVEAYNMQGGQYKKMGDRKLEKFCESLYTKSARTTYDGFNNAATVKIPFGTCPYPAGKNELTNYMIDEGSFLPPYLPGGEKWRIDIRIATKGEILGGYNLFLALRNEKSLLNGG